jgi:hypothetical protein
LNGRRKKATDVIWKGSGRARLIAEQIVYRKVGKGLTNMCDMTDNCKHSVGKGRVANGELMEMKMKRT